MKFANLVLQSPIIRSRHDLFPAAGRGQAALRHQPTPGEQLVWGNAMPTSHQAYRHTWLEGLFDHANLLRRCSTPVAPEDRLGPGDQEVLAHRRVRLDPGDQEVLAHRRVRLARGALV